MGSFSDQGSFFDRDYERNTQFFTASYERNALLVVCEWSAKPSKTVSVATFLRKLKRVPISSEEESCSICMESYPREKLTFLVAKILNLERPVRLPCGHTAGTKCIRKWFESGHDNCPMCRCVFDIKSDGTWWKE